MAWIGEQRAKEFIKGFKVVLVCYAGAGAGAGKEFGAEESSCVVWV